MLRAFHRLIWRLDLFTVLVFRKKNWFLVSILLLGAQFKSISSESISRLRALHLSKVDLFSTFIQQILQKELSLLVGGLGHTMFIRHLFFFHVHAFRNSMLLCGWSDEHVFAGKPGGGEGYQREKWVQFSIHTLWLVCFVFLLIPFVQCLISH